MWRILDLKPGMWWRGDISDWCHRLVIIIVFPNLWNWSAIFEVGSFQNVLKWGLERTAYNIQMLNCGCDERTNTQGQCSQMCIGSNMHDTLGGDIYVYHSSPNRIWINVRRKENSRKGIFKNKKKQKIFSSVDAFSCELDQILFHNIIHQLNLNFKEQSVESPSS